MRRLLAALAISASTFTPALAQGTPPQEVVAQQQQLQSLLDDAIVAVRASNEAQAACARVPGSGVIPRGPQPRRSRG
jgi:hypothetical protein